MFAPSGEARNTIALRDVVGGHHAPQRGLRDRFIAYDLGRDAAQLCLAGVHRFDSFAGDRPGQIALTRMPCGPSSIDSDLVKPMTPHFDAA
mgnify:CR=1 FL=1